MRRCGTSGALRREKRCAAAEFPALASAAACAALAAAGHGQRTLLVGQADVSVVWASMVGALVIGLLSVPASSHWRTPAESMSFPALLPMIPGMYAYRAVQAFLLCVEHPAEAEFMHYLYQLSYNGFVCGLIVLLMFVGVTVPIFCLGRYSFSATR